MRSNHWLPKNKKSTIPSRFIFVDTESHIEHDTTNTEKHTLWFGSAVFVRFRTKGEYQWKHEERFEFHTPDEFWTWLVGKTQNRTRTYVYAHNWNYDAAILSLSTVAQADGWECTRYVNNKPPFIMQLRQGSRTLLFVDTLNYFASSLKALGESIGVPKFSYPESDATPEEWKDYNFQDVEVIKQAVLSFRDFIREHDLGNMKETLAGQAFTAYRHRFMGNKILIHDNEDICALERSAYYGGRTEAFYIGDYSGPLYYLDINSMYPYIMSSSLIPNIFRSPMIELPLDYVQRRLEKYSIIGQVEIETDEPIYPVKHNGRLIFPVGKFTTTLCSPELKIGLERGHVKRFIKGARYSHDYIFSEYVDYFYNLRKEYTKQGNPVYSYACKIMLNSLYGKFGQNGNLFIDVREAYADDLMEWTEYDSVTREIFKYRQRMGRIQYEKKEGESTHSFPAISAHVTSYGRVMLWELFEQAGRENVLYTDTDSLIVTEDGYRRVENRISSSTLGALKIEAVIDKASIFAPKDYILDNQVRHKGVRATAKQISRNTWEHYTFRSWDWLLKQGSDGYVIVEHGVKTLYRQPKKGKITTSGWTEPYSVPGDIVISGIS